MRNFEVWFERGIPSESFWFFLFNTSDYFHLVALTRPLGHPKSKLGNLRVAPWLLLRGSYQSQWVCCMRHPPCVASCKSKQRFAWWVLVLSFWTLGSPSARSKWPGISNMSNFLSGPRQWRHLRLKVTAGILWAHLGQSKGLLQTCAEY